jgi:putative spermidine/putrescine transport system permease protein
MLPFGLLLMFAVSNRFDKSYEEAARSGGERLANARLCGGADHPPSLISVALFGFTLSYDEFGRTLLTAGVYTTLPLEIYGMTTNITSPALLALGTLTTSVSFDVIGLFLAVSLGIWKRRDRHVPHAGKGP